MVKPCQLLPESSQKVYVSAPSRCHFSFNAWQKLQRSLSSASTQQAIFTEKQCSISLHAASHSHCNSSAQSAL